MDLEVLERGASRLAHHQVGRLDVFAVAAVLQQVRRGFVDVLGQGEVLNVYLARATAPAPVRRSTLSRAPGPGQDIDLALVLVVARLTLDSINLEEHIDGHGLLPLRLLPVTGTDSVHPRGYPALTVRTRGPKLLFTRKRKATSGQGHTALVSNSSPAITRNRGHRQQAWVLTTEQMTMARD